MRKLVLFDAVAFCFGPASTLQLVLDELLESNLDLMVLSSGTTADFLSGYSERCVLIPCDSEDPNSMAQHNNLFRNCSLFVSNTNPISARYALERGVPTLYLDTLFWMWDRIDPLIAESAIYVAQTFAGIEENRHRIGAKIRDFRLVGPLAGRSPKTIRTGDCLISFGGMASKLTIPGVTNRYAWLMTRLLLEAFERKPAFDRYLFRGNGAVMLALEAEFGDSCCEFAFSPRNRHLEEMASARNLFLSPGLTGCYEAINAEVPTWLLPPQNYSQQLQAETFLSFDPSPFKGFHWGTIYPDLVPVRYMPEIEAVRLLSTAVRRFEEDREAQRRYVDLLVDAMPFRRRPVPPEDAAFCGDGAAAQVAGMIRQAAGELGTA